MGLVVLVSPDLEECSIPRQWVKKVCEFSSRGSIHNFNKLKKATKEYCKRTDNF